MQDFNSFNKSKNTQSQNQSQTQSESGFSGIMELVKNLSKKYDGKSQNELYSAVIREAEKRKRAGTLKNEDLDGFAQMLSPMLDENKRKVLNKIITQLKKI